MGCVGFLIPRLPPFSGLFARFCVLTGTGNSTTTLCYCILYVEQNNFFFFSGAKKCCGKFSNFLWNSDNLGEVSIDFFSEIESCFNETRYRVTRRRHFKTNKQTNESGLQDPYSSKKSRLRETFI